MKVFRPWHLKDIILVTLIGAFCGAIFWGSAFIYNIVAAILTPLGLLPYAAAATIGFWTMAGPLAAMVIRIPGSAILGELLGSFVEMVLGSEWGVADLLSGFLQGLGSELGFAVLGYKNYGWLSVFTTSLTTTIFSFGWTFVKDGYGNFGFLMNLSLFVVWFASVFIFSGVLPYLVNRLLERSHVLDNR